MPSGKVDQLQGAFMVAPGLRALTPADERLLDLHDPGQPIPVRADHRPAQPWLDWCREAGEVRRTWLREWLTRKTAPKGTAWFVVGMLASHADLLQSYGGSRLAAGLVGEEPEPYGGSHALSRLIDQVDDKRVQVITLALVLAACEDHVVKDTWRGDGTSSWHGRYLRFLVDQGYTLAEVEGYAASDNTV